MPSAQPYLIGAGASLEGKTFGRNLQDLLGKADFKTIEIFVGVLMGYLDIVNRRRSSKKYAV